MLDSSLEPDRVVGWRPDTRHAWGARALALSQWGRGGYVASTIYDNISDAMSIAMRFLVS